MAKSLNDKLEKEQDKVCTYEFSFQHFCNTRFVIRFKSYVKGILYFTKNYLTISEMYCYFNWCELQHINLFQILLGSFVSRKKVAAINFQELKRFRYIAGINFCDCLFWDLMETKMTSFIKNCYTHHQRHHKHKSLNFRELSALKFF